MEEVWKDVLGYEEYFKVSSTGQVWSKRTSKILKQTPNKKGYFNINSRIGGRSGVAISLRVHRMVAEAFLPEPSNDLIEKALTTVYGKVLVNHKDCDKTNNKVDNLEWIDYLGNSRHAVENGRFILPKRDTSETPYQVDYILKTYHKGSHSTGIRKISRDLCICRSITTRVLRENNRI